MVTFSTYLSGPEALTKVDGVIAQARGALRDAIAAADDAKARAAEVREAQMAAYRELAKIRFDILQDAERDDNLDRLHQQALTLIDRHDEFVAAEAKALSEAAKAIDYLEGKRNALAHKHEEAVATYEAKVEEVEARLREQPDYQALAKASDDAAAVADRARQKLEVARADRAEKGKPYDEDPLFSYLWKRGFRTTAYRAGTFIRTLDNWVAKLCKYDDAYLNYKRLTELPERLAEHVETVAAKADAALDALEAAEDDALEAAGAGALRKTAEAIKADVEATDAEIEKAEAHHRDVAERHEQALKAEHGPAVEAQKLLEDGLRRASFPDLRRLAAETLGGEDDALVDDLVRLRAEEMATANEADRATARPATLRGELKRLEEFRRDFKRARLDSSFAQLSGPTVDEAVSGVTHGDVSPDSGVRMIKRSMRRLGTRVDPGFGGRRRARTLGLPEILGEVAWEIAREASRSGGSWGNVGMPRPRRRSSSSFPRSRPRVSRPRRSGGFKTGGGF